MPEECLTLLADNDGYRKRTVLEGRAEHWTNYSELKQGRP